MGERERKPLQLTFNGLLKVDFQGSRVTSDGGLILVRELDERLGLGKLIGEYLSDSRKGTNKQFRFADLLRQSVYSRLAGYEDLNDAARVSADPTFRLIGSKKNWDRVGALTSRRQSFEAELLASEENLLGLMAVTRELVAQAEAQDDSERVVLDMDSTESPVHGQQEGSADAGTGRAARHGQCCRGHEYGDGGDDSGGHADPHLFDNGTVLVAEPGRWFSYNYWLDDAKAPDFARTVDIHRKPGYDPVELFLDPEIRLPQLTVGWKLLKRKLSFGNLLDVIPLDPSLVRGSHGRVDQAPPSQPVLITQGDLGEDADELPVTAMRDIILDNIFRN